MLYRVVNIGISDTVHEIMDVIKIKELIKVRDEIKFLYTRSNIHRKHINRKERGDMVVRVSDGGASILNSNPFAGHQ